MTPYPHIAFARMAQAVEAASADLRAALEAAAGHTFPTGEIRGLAEDPRFETLEAVDGKVRAFFSSGCDAELRAIEDLTGTDFDALIEQVEAWTPFRTRIHPEYLEAGNGAVEAVPHFAPSRGARRFHSLGNAALEGAIEASVFDHPLRAEPLYDGRRALEARQSGQPLPAPVGVAADFRVAVLDGLVRHPPLHPSDIERPVSTGYEEMAP